MPDRILHGLAGAVLGGLIAFGGLYFLDETSWLLVGTGAGVCGLLGAAFGEPFLRFLKDLW